MKFRKRPDALQGRVPGSLSKLKRDTFVGNFVSVGSRCRARHVRIRTYLLPTFLEFLVSGRRNWGTKKRFEVKQALKVNTEQPRGISRDGTNFSCAGAHFDVFERRRRLNERL